MKTVYDEVTKCSKTLMFNEPFYGLFLISLNKVLDSNIPTACVGPQGINVQLKINPTFWQSLDEKTKIGVLKHELLHLCFFHLSAWGKYENKQIFNIAADLEVNQYISPSMKGEKWEFWELDSPHVAHLKLEPKQGTKYYYDKLMQEAKDNPEGAIGQIGSSMQFEFMDVDGSTFSELSETTQKLVNKQIEHKLKELAENLIKKGNGAGRGYIPGELQNLIDGLFTVEEPVTDWKGYIRRFNSVSPVVYTKKSRRKPNRRFEENPALKLKFKKRILLAIDTSGSVNDAELVEFFNEILYIHKTGTFIDVIECDSKIQRVYEYKGKQESFSVCGRGGTDFEPVMQYLMENRDKYATIIYFTDGECSSPETKPAKPILWVHSSRSTINESLPGLKVKITR